MARYSLDTNVLLRAAAPKSAHHATAVEAIKRLLGGGDELFLAPQVLVEFWSVVALLNIHSVPHLLTFNVGDFQAYGTLAISPEQV